MKYHNAHDFYDLACQACKNIYGDDFIRSFPDLVCELTDDKNFWTKVWSLPATHEYPRGHITSEHIRLFEALAGPNGKTIWEIVQLRRESHKIGNHCKSGALQLTRGRSSVKE